MDGIKPWQLAIIVIGLVGGIGLVGWNLLSQRSLNTPDQLILMDVTTGQRYIADVSGRKAIFIPEKNPETLEYTLLPIVKGDDGKWRTRYVDIVRSYPPEVAKAFEDVDQGIVRPSEAKPKPLKP